MANNNIKSDASVQAENKTPNRFLVGVGGFFRAIFVKNLAFKCVALLLGVVTYILVNIL